MYLPSERALFFAKKEEERERKLTVIAGRRCGKSILSVLSTAKEYLSKEEYERFESELLGELEFIINNNGFKVIEENREEWIPAYKVFKGELND